MNGKNVIRTCRDFNIRHPDLVPMNNTKFKMMKNNFETYGKVKAIKTYPSRIVENEDNVINVLPDFHSNKSTSTRNQC